MSQEIKSKRGRKPLSPETMAARNTSAIEQAKNYGISITPNSDGTISRTQYYYIQRRIKQINAKAASALNDEPAVFVNSSTIFS